MCTHEAIVSIHKSIDEIIQASKGLSEDLLRWKPEENVWSVMEILCHVEEATPYWLNELQQTVKNPELEWGRGLQHEGRLAAVAAADGRNIADVLQKLEGSKELVQGVLSQLQETHLKMEATSKNPRFGTKRLQFIVDHLLVEHLAKHLEQINRNLLKYQEAKQKI